MSPEKLVELLTSLNRAADLVEAIDDRALQDRRGWDLSRWEYELIPWGVRFEYQEPDTRGRTEVQAVMAFGQAGPLPGRPHVLVRWPTDPDPADLRTQPGV
jgi:hypothetical protein